MANLKIVVAGPKGAGKTTIANYIAGGRDSLSLDSYQPTIGVRILEMEMHNASIELWDSSGDHSFESCWKAIMAEADGVILVFSPDVPGQDQQISDWFDFFVKRNGLKEDQCMIFAHKSGDASENRFRPPPLFTRVMSKLTTPNSGAEIRGMFEDFIKTAMSIKRASGGHK